MQFAQRQRLFPIRRGPLLAAVPVGLLIGFVGPFGSYPAFPAFTRYAFWLGLTVVGVLAAIAVDAAIPSGRLARRRVRIPAVTLASTIPMTFVVAWTISLVQTGRTYSPSQLVDLFWGVAAVQLFIVVMLVISVSEFDASRPAPLMEPVTTDTPPIATSVPAGAEAPAFPAVILGKLPTCTGGEIMALETEDHYLRVHAAQGSGLVLMRMADAVALIDERLGMQVHRRWWVASAAVDGLHTENQKWSLRLANGLDVPVGRTFLTAARVRFADRRG